MLDLARCRELLGPTNLTDEQVLELRSYMYGLAHAVVQRFEEKRQRPASAGVE